jgi:hypothetical protein
MYAPGVGGHFVAQGGAGAFGQPGGPRMGGANFGMPQQIGGPQMRVAAAQVPRWNNMTLQAAYGLSLFRNLSVQTGRILVGTQG